jgi:hypothetical protein
MTKVGIDHSYIVAKSALCSRRPRMKKSVPLVKQSCVNTEKLSIT